MVVAGHGRLKAAEQLGMQEVPVIVADDLTDEQVQAYRLVDNKVSELAEYDLDLLREELDAIKLIDMEDFGFDDNENNFEEESVENDVTEDSFTGEVPEEPKSVRGELYQLGSHRLMCGDSTSVTDVSELMDGKQADMIFTDPPYGYNYQSNMRTASDKFDVIENDDVMLDFMPVAKKFNRGFVYICASWKNIEDWIKLFKEHFKLTNLVVWSKGRGGMGDLEKTFSTDYEMILVSHNDKPINGKRIGSVWEFLGDNPIDYVHPTQKPVALVAQAIKSSTVVGEKVLDLFGGSGTTLIACEQLKRKCRVMELDPRYVDVIINRWETLTGETAIKIN